MRVLRAKQTRKYLRFFQIVFGIKAPYNVLLDGNFVFTLMKLKLDIRDRLSKLLQGSELKYFMLTSALNELKSVGAKARAAVEFALAFCEIIDDSAARGETPADKLLNYVDAARNNAAGKKFFVATQDRNLRHSLAGFAGVPIIYTNKVSVVLEAPSEASKKFGMGIEIAKTELSITESTIVEAAEKAVAAKAARAAAASTGASAGAVAAPPENKQRVKRKATAANPLSVAPAQADSANTKKRKLNKYKK